MFGQLPGRSVFDTPKFVPFSVYYFQTSSARVGHSFLAPTFFLAEEARCWPACVLAIVHAWSVLPLCSLCWARCILLLATFKFFTQARPALKKAVKKSAIRMRATIPPPNWAR